MTGREIEHVKLVDSLLGPLFSRVQLKAGDIGYAKTSLLGVLLVVWMTVVCYFLKLGNVSIPSFLSNIFRK